MLYPLLAMPILGCFACGMPHLHFRSEECSVQLCIENFDNDIPDIKQEGKFRRFITLAMLIDTPLYEDAPVEKNMWLKVKLNT